MVIPYKDMDDNNKLGKPESKYMVVANIGNSFNFLRLHNKRGWAEVYISHSVTRYTDENHICVEKQKYSLLMFPHSGLTVIFILKYNYLSYIIFVEHQITIITHFEHK